MFVDEGLLQYHCGFKKRLEWTKIESVSTNTNTNNKYYSDFSEIWCKTNSIKTS